MKEKIKQKFKSFCEKTKLNKLPEKLKSFCKFLKLDKVLDKLKSFCKFIKLDKLFNKLKKVDKEIYIKTFILILIPILIYLYCQFFCNGKLIFEPKRMLLNFMFI